MKEGLTNPELDGMYKDAMIHAFYDHRC